MEQPFYPTPAELRQAKNPARVLADCLDKNTVTRRRGYRPGSYWSLQALQDRIGVSNRVWGETLDLLVSRRVIRLNGIGGAVVERIHLPPFQVSERVQRLLTLRSGDLREIDRATTERGRSQLAYGILRSRLEDAVRDELKVGDYLPPVTWLCGFSAHMVNMSPSVVHSWYAALENDGELAINRRTGGQRPKLPPLPRADGQPHNRSAGGAFVIDSKPAYRWGLERWYYTGQLPH